MASETGDDQKEQGRGPGTAMAEIQHRQIATAIRTHSLFCQVTRDCVIKDVNPAFCALVDFTADELIGSSIIKLQSDRLGEEFWSKLWGDLASGNSWRGQLPGQQRDGSTFWLDAIMLPSHDDVGNVEYIVIIANDSTPRHRAEEALSRMGHILEQSYNEIYVFDAATLKFILVNRGARENLGYTHEDLESIGPLDLKPMLNQRQFDALLAPLRAGTEDLVVFETVHKRKDGSTYPVQVSLHYARTEVPPVFIAVVQNLTDRKRREEQVAKLAMYDHLTGIANRSSFFERFGEEIGKATAAGQRLHLFYMDLDRFKNINDGLGHAMGDLVLIGAARRLASVFAESGFLARIGGDEFVALVPETPGTNLDDLAARIVAIFQHGLTIGNQRHSVGISVGIATFPDHADTPDRLVRHADLAMYDAKAQQCGYRHYTADQGHLLARRQRLATELAHALDNDTLELFYQPFNRIDTGDLQGAEALLRWHHEDLGAIPPRELIGIARDHRLLGRLSSWIVARVCRQIADWRALGLCLPERVSINVEPEQVYDGSICDDLKQWCTVHDVDPKMIEIEITESVMIQDLSSTNTVLRELKSLGASIAIDDFGTGYSSLRYLNTLAVDRLKIDMSFITDIIENPVSRQIVAATIAMANGLAIGTIAEGVETQAQATELGAIGCRQVQGWLFSESLPPTAFADKWLQSTSIPTTA